MIEKNNTSAQKLILNDRRELFLDAVESVNDFSDSLLILSTKYGDVYIEGNGMKIMNLSEKDGTVSVVGKIDGIYFKEPKSGGLFGGLFK